MGIKPFLMAIGLIVIGTIAYSQSEIRFTYDDSGNRIERRLIILGDKSAQIGDSNSTKENVLVENQGGLQIRIYPNPTKGRVKLEIPSYEAGVAGEIHVFDPNGRKVLSQKRINHINTIDLSMVKNGIYFLKLTYGGQRVDWKIIKQ